MTCVLPKKYEVKIERINDKGENKYIAGVLILYFEKEKALIVSWSAKYIPKIKIELYYSKDEYFDFFTDNIQQLIDIIYEELEKQNLEDI